MDWLPPGPEAPAEAICDVRTWYGKFLLAADGRVMIWEERPDAGWRSTVQTRGPKNSPSLDIPHDSLWPFSLHLAPTPDSQGALNSHLFPPCTTRDDSSIRALITDLPLIG